MRAQEAGVNEPVVQPGKNGGPRLFRRRLIPDETVPLDGDELVMRDGGVIVTVWRTLKPRADFSRGVSCYFTGEGYKVSKLFTKDGAFLYYYCDIIKTLHNPADDSYVFTDLLFDVIVEPDGFVRVLDLNEGAEALKSGLITNGELCFALDALARLLDIIYSGGFGDLTYRIDEIEL